MKCEEFRTILNKGDTNALTEHLDGCPDCVRWLDGTLKKAPDGLLPGVFAESPERVARHLPIPGSVSQLTDHPQISQITAERKNISSVKNDHFSPEAYPSGDCPKDSRQWFSQKSGAGDVPPRLAPFLAFGGHTPHRGESIRFWGMATLWREVMAAFALGAVAAAIWMVTPRIQPQLPQINFHHEEFSFLEEKSDKIDIDFLDSEQIVVTEDHFEFSQKEKWSFLETENSYTFIEDEQEEKS